MDPEAEEGGPLFKLNEKDEEGNGGFKVMNASVLDDADNWEHHPLYPSIFHEGRGVTLLRFDVLTHHPARRLLHVADHKAGFFLHLN